ncbi:UNVERIFIED_CONTAM: hypothetical protein Slati_3733300 [Sesamum latifolium]|uniref:Uncharacterized protein n=1 Tax=Sesamum latifolium TaxID=2727402 RepID=A0AAW2U6T8_9LAMI
MGKGGQNYGRSEDVGGAGKEPKGDYYAAWSKDVRDCEEKYQVSRDYGLCQGMRLKNGGRSID